jgi:hypothetical protein
MTAPVDSVELPVLKTSLNHESDKTPPDETLERIAALEQRIAELAEKLLA